MTTTMPQKPTCSRGDVVLVLFPHSDLRTAKPRPAVVVQANDLDTGMSQVIVAMISSRMFRAGQPRPQQDGVRLQIAEPRRLTARTTKLSSSQPTTSPYRRTLSRGCSNARFAGRGLPELDDRVAVGQPDHALGQLADEEIFQRSVGCIAASEPDNTRRRAKALHHFCKVGILRHDGCVSRPRRSKDRRIEGVTQPKVARWNTLYSEAFGNPSSNGR